MHGHTTQGVHANYAIIPALMHEPKDNLIELFRTGVELKGVRFRCAVVGVKGDLKPLTMKPLVPPNCKKGIYHYHIMSKGLDAM